jgi:hypothetical protein
LHPVNAKAPPKIPSGLRAANRRTGPLAVPTRDDLSRAKTLQRGEKNKADLLELDLGEGPVVVKDFAAKAWWVRLLGRLQVWREHRAYRRVGGLPGIPVLVGRIDAHALAIEKIEGRQLGKARDRQEEGTAKLSRLRAILDRIHETGLVHLDLRARENVLVTAEGEIYVVDFASALWLKPESLAHRLLFPWLRRVDESALLKWKILLEAGELTEKERSDLQRHHFWRALWIFNPRGRGRSARGGPDQGAPGRSSSDDAK